MIEKGLKLHTYSAVPRMEGGAFLKEVRMEGGRGSGCPASHTRTFPDLVPPSGNDSRKCMYFGLGMMPNGNGCLLYGKKSIHRIL